MTENISLESYKDATKREIIEVAARSFRTHIIVFVAVNVLSAILNFILLPEYLFFYFATLGWGAGLAVQYFLGYRRREEIADERVGRIEDLARRSKRTSKTSNGGR